LSAVWFSHWGFAGSVLPDIPGIDILVCPDASRSNPALVGI
jgi:hypothetical protein